MILQTIFINRNNYETIPQLRGTITLSDDQDNEVKVTLTVEAVSKIVATINGEIRGVLTSLLSENNGQLSHK